jgi:hypothetical protein
MPTAERNCAWAAARSDATGEDSWVPPWYYSQIAGYIVFETKQKLTTTRGFLVPGAAPHWIAKAVFYFMFSNSVRSRYRRLYRHAWRLRSQLRHAKGMSDRPDPCWKNGPARPEKVVSRVMV